MKAQDRHSLLHNKDSQNSALPKDSSEFRTSNKARVVEFASVESVSDTVRVVQATERLVKHERGTWYRRYPIKFGVCAETH